MTNPGNTPPPYPPVSPNTPPPPTFRPEHARPYDQTLGLDYVGMIQTQIEAGVSFPHVLDRPTPMPSPVAHPRGYEHHPGLISQAGTAVSGLAKVLSQDGRSQLADKRQRRADVVRHAADRMRDTRNTPVNADDPGSAPGDNPAAKTEWNGTNQASFSGKAPNPTGLGDAYDRLMQKGPYAPGAQPTDSMPNSLRPVTRSEKSAVNRMSAHEETRAYKENRARWLRGSYGSDLDADPDGTRVSTGDQRKMRGVSKTIGRLVRGGRRAADRVDDIARSEDFRGRHSR
jgi:hypothetical protein